MPTPDAFDLVLVFARERGARPSYTKGSCPAYILHGLKHRGVTDTAGNRGDKQDAAGHQSPTTTGRYDHALPVVKPPRRR